MERKTTQFLWHFLRGYPRRTALMVTLLVLAGFAEGVGLVTLLPLLHAVMPGEGAGEKHALAEAVEEAIRWTGLEPSLGVLLIVLVAGLSLKAVLVWLGMTQVGYALARVTLDLRLRLIRSLMRARWSYFVRQPLGGFANAVASEAHRASNAFREACAAAATAVQGLAYFAVALALSWPVALAGAVAGAGFIFGLRGFLRMSRSAGSDLTSLMSSLTERLTDTVHGIKAMKAMGQEHRYAPVLEERTKGLEMAERKHVLASESMQVFQEPLIATMVAIGMVVVLALSQMAFSSLILLIFIFYRLLRVVNSTQIRIQVMLEGESAYWSILDKIERAEAQEEFEAGELDAPDLTEGIRFEEVSFAYDTTPVIESVSFTIPAGRFIAIVGESGSGKTTLGDLSASLIEPGSGSILVDGVPLALIRRRAWRERIGYVPQEILLLHDSILNNVTLRDPTLTEDEVVSALRLAGAWEFVERLPRGIHEVTGERGGSLSGGQRQRIGLARALVRSPRLLILDEVTAALDPQTELSIARTLRDLAGPVTILSISHRSTINELADIVLHVEDGRVLHLPPEGRKSPLGLTATKSASSSDRRPLTELEDDAGPGGIAKGGARVVSGRTGEGFVDTGAT